MNFLAKITRVGCSNWRKSAPPSIGNFGCILQIKMRPLLGGLCLFFVGFERDTTRLQSCQQSLFLHLLKLMATFFVFPFFREMESFERRPWLFWRQKNVWAFVKTLSMHSITKDGRICVLLTGSRSVKQEDYSIKGYALLDW